MVERMCWGGPRALASAAEVHACGASTDGLFVHNFELKEMLRLVLIPLVILIVVAVVNFVTKSTAHEAELYEYSERKALEVVHSQIYIDMIKNMCGDTS